MAAFLYFYSKFLTVRLFLISIFLFSAFCSTAAEPSLVSNQNVVIENVESEIQLINLPPDCKDCIAKLNGKKYILTVNELGESTITATLQRKSLINVSSSSGNYNSIINLIPLWLSIIPPLLAIILALVFKEVVTSLLIGIFSGVFIIHIYFNSFWMALISSFTILIDHYILDSLNDSGHLSIIIFSTLIGGMVSVISKNGGMQGVVNRISKFAKTPKSGQLATWFLGIAIFFDDYANTLIVGNTMRPITDRLKISREKLAYLVDSTAAPIAAIAFVTTWIGAELGYIESGIATIEGLNEGVYSIFLSSLAYSFYPIFALLFMLILILRERDFGPMYHAEKEARMSDVMTIDPLNLNEELDEFTAKEGIPYKAFNAIVPVLVVILGTIIGLISTGWDTTVIDDSSISLSRTMSTIIGNADSYKALLWSSLAGLFMAIILSVSQKLMSIHQSINAAVSGFKTMLTAVIILVLAWSLALVIEDLHTADFLTSIMSDNVSPYFVPTLTFLLAAVVAFSTGSSWGTMAILYPLMLPSSWAICLTAGIPEVETLSIFHNVVACVLAGAVLGDHCSPISDTTILSSLASSCNHISHVRTQMPYALTVGAVAILFGIIPAAFGIPFWITLPCGIIAMYLIIGKVGKKIEFSTRKVEENPS
ncbi:MAG: Na+/H+ antiporter NhaC [Vicingaceae bacterium]|jgi:Na+/H+ antiporter NhaC